MNVLCLGGGLQGVEAVFLGHKADWTMTVVDRNPKAPATGLADYVIEADLLTLEPRQLMTLSSGFDFIIAALEDGEVISEVSALSADNHIPPVIIDPEPYFLSASKIKSKQLFHRLSLPMAAPWRPNSAGSFVAKPSGSSGSRGVVYFDNSEAVEKQFPSAASQENLVIEQRLDGPQYSVEVTARQGQARSWPVTRLEMDAVSDCCRVIAPSGLSPEREREFGNMACQLAKELGLTGLMDLEAVDCQGEFKLLEIDARFPSQTPTAIFFSTGINLLEEMAACFVPITPKSPSEGLSCPRRVIYEHIQSKNGVQSCLGEHIMTSRGPLISVPGFLGATEALVSRDWTNNDFVATLIWVND
ncbi:MAG: 3-methylornithine--L-lysine ligase PylC [Deltaproteobacteria bacterium]|nr:3-methylornithine--L-lysine ligase PylC [Deltaproteobacteria bacterium]